MNHRQRVERCLSHQEPDRVPIDYWCTMEVDTRLIDVLGYTNKEEVLKHFDVDCRYLLGPSYIGQTMKEYDDGTIEDLWGVRRASKRVQQHKGGHYYEWTYKHVAISPLEHMTSVSEIENYDKWPNADNWDYSGFESQCDRYHGDYIVINKGDRLDRTAQFKPMMYLRGMEQAYMDLAINPEITECIIENIKSYFLEYNERVFKAANGKIDIFMMGDDFGTQHGLMMSVDMWRHYFKPGFRAYVELAHRYGMKTMHHTCGSVIDLIPEFIDCGLDILQSLQPRARGMDLEKLKQEYGKDICFHGGMDIQHTLPNGTPDDVREMVKTQIEKGKPGGGYIACTAHNIQPDTPTDNIKALFEAYQEYGNY